MNTKYGFEADEEIPAVFDVCVKDNKMIAANNIFNELLELDLQNYQVSHLSMYDIINGKIHNTYRRICCFEDNYYFFGHAISKLSEENELVILADKVSVNGESQYIDIVNVLAINQKVYCFQRYLDQCIIVFDMENENIEYNCDIYREITQRTGIDTKDLRKYSIFDIIYVERQIWFALKNSNYIFSFNPDNFDLKMYSIPKRFKLHAIGHDGDRFILLLLNCRELYVWDKYKIEEITLDNTIDYHECSGECVIYSRVVNIYDNVFILSFCEDYIYIYDKKNQSIRNIFNRGDNYKLIHYYQIGATHWWGFYPADNSTVMFFSAVSNGAFVYNIKKKTGEFINFKYQTKHRHKIYMKNVMQNYVRNEMKQEYCTQSLFETFVELVVECKPCKNEQYKEINGAKIWRKVKEWEYVSPNPYGTNL